MDPNDEDLVDAAWAQLELEARSYEYNELFASDPDYTFWLDNFNQQENGCAQSQ